MRFMWDNSFIKTIGSYGCCGFVPGSSGTHFALSLAGINSLWCLTRPEARDAADSSAKLTTGLEEPGE